MQLLCPTGDPSGHGGQLNLLAHRGLSADSIAFWQWVRPTAHSSCAVALQSGQRAIISDYEACDAIKGTDDLRAFQDVGIRAAQTTPLISRRGELLGMISTHWSEPHEPSQRDLRMLDILARQAADLLERTKAEEALRSREKALRESESLQKILTGELSHRVKNMLATVQAIATQTHRHSKTPAEFVSSFSGRIQSMACVHAQLSTNEWKGAQLRAIAQDQMSLGAVDEARVSIAGPEVYLAAEAVPKMAMMLHELGTNSIKYGALSKPDGAVAIDWKLTDEMLHLYWTERGGPAVKTPVRRGFGSNLIIQSATSVGGSASMAVEAQGVRWDISLPLSETVVAADAQPISRAGIGITPLTVVAAVQKEAPKTLEGKRFLLVEDEPLVAMDIAEHLEGEGAHIIGPAGNVRSALDLIQRVDFDAALLDANLSGDSVGEIAAALTRKNVPFAFVSGYGRESLPQSFGAVEVLAKPFGAPQLLALAAKLAGHHALLTRPVLSGKY